VLKRRLADLFKLRLTSNGDYRLLNCATRVMGEFGAVSVVRDTSGDKPTHCRCMWKSSITNTTLQRRLRGFFTDIPCRDHAVVKESVFLKTGNTGRRENRCQSY
jgi:hypothetical protein